MVIELTIVSFYPKYILSTEDLILRDVLTVCVMTQLLKGAQSRLNGLNSLAKLLKLFKFVVCNPCQSSSSLTILVPLWFIIISLVFFYLQLVC